MFLRIIFHKYYVDFRRDFLKIINIPLNLTIIINFKIILTLINIYS